MYKLAQEFTFQAAHTTLTVATSFCPKEEHLHQFTGQLVFKNALVNQYGTLHTENDLKRFSDVLNSLILLPEFWSLELIAKELYNHGVSLFPDLNSVVLYLTEMPFRVVEYMGTDEAVIPISSLEESSEDELLH